MHISPTCLVYFLCWYESRIYRSEVVGERRSLHIQRRGLYLHRLPVSLEIPAYSTLIGLDCPTISAKVGQSLNLLLIGTLIARLF